MIKINNVNKSFITSEGRFDVLKNVSLSIEDGSCTVIGGENGSGKSVLMSIIAGLEESDSGKVECKGRPGLVFQEAETQILGETPREDIAFGPKNLGFKKEEIKKIVEDTLAKTGLSAKQQRQLAVAVKRARHLALMPFVANA